MEVEKVLVLSTGHLEYQEFNNLVPDFHSPFRATQHEYGTIVFLSGEAPEFEDKHRMMFPNLIPIVEYALSKGIKYLNFDQDGLEYDEFRSFNW